MSESKGIKSDGVKAGLHLADKLVELYETTADILHEGIKSGRSNIPQGLISLLMYADLLHGGAYSAPINQIPHYSKDGEGKPDIRLPDLSSVYQNEIIENSDVPHIFPKLLSDQAYYLVKEWVNLTMTEHLVRGASTSVRTLVEGGTGRKGRLAVPAFTKTEEKEE